MIKLKLWILLLLGTQVAYAQKRSGGEAPDDNVKKYLDDGRVSRVDNLVRIRLNPLWRGYAGLSYEHKISPKFGLEGGLYVKAYTSLSQADLNNLAFSEQGHNFSFEKMNGGLYVLAYPKLYLSGRGINYGHFVGLRTGYRTFSADMSDSYISSKGVSCTDIPVLLMFGSHQQVGSRFTLGIEWGFGINKYSYKNLYVGNYDYNAMQLNKQLHNISFISPALLLDLNFGILF